MSDAYETLRDGGFLDDEDSVRNLIEQLEHRLTEFEKDKEPQRNFDDIHNQIVHAFNTHTLMDARVEVPALLYSLAANGYYIQFEDTRGDGVHAALHRLGDPHALKWGHVCEVTSSDNRYGAFSGDDSIDAAAKILAYAYVEAYGISSCLISTLTSPDRKHDAVDFTSDKLWCQKYQFTFEIDGELRTVDSPYRHPGVAAAILATFDALPSEDPAADLELVAVHSYTLKPKHRFVLNPEPVWTA